MQNLIDLIEALDRFTAFLERSPATGLVLVCFTALVVLGLGFAVLAYVVHKFADLASRVRA